MTVDQTSEQTIKPLSMADRLHLAALILDDIPPHAVVDYSNEWSAEDLTHDGPIQGMDLASRHESEVHLSLGSAAGFVIMRWLS